ncbi:ABC transporter permease [Sporolactobacillus kofuensis]|uniref:ABC transporter permease n=1 Tax=Sporolactobacillus kofuensis TaxID=269672 RepID=A0ABW1WHT2_9BACL|nr:ABC transporter permease [Sporolactobacillus kofuensis]MCO7177127.1 ABC transporter permease [Sporolactobacillus kofuensis]
MPVFNLCLKIIRKNWISISIYLAIFLVISVLLSTNSAPKETHNFSQEKAKLVFISKDHTPLTEGFRKELAKSATFVKIPDNTEKLQDALFFRQATYILRIPKGFTENVLNGGSMQLEKTIVPNSAENAYVDLSVNQYWRLAKLYAKHEPQLSEKQLADKLSANFSHNTPIEMKAQIRAKTDQGFSMYYFNFLAYTLSAVLILGISTVMIVFNKNDLRRRNFCSPVHASSINSQMILANLLFAAISWVILVGFCFIFDSKNIMTPNMIYFLLNSAVFTLCISCISYLIGNLLGNLRNMSAVCNVVTLGPCFISGVFVPQQFLGETILKIARFTPTYWYVQANDEISQLTRFTWTDLSPVFYNIAVLIGFSLAFLALSLVVGKRKRLTDR